MNKFILLKAATPGAYERALESIRDHSLGALTFRPDRIRVDEYPDELTLFANFELSDSAGFKKHYVSTTQNSTFAFDGLPFTSTLEVGKNWAKQFDLIWRDDRRCVESLYGTWAFARYVSGEGGRALTDFTGMTPLYYFRDSSYLAISPRQMLLSAVCGSSRINEAALAWLAGQANVIGNDAVWENVKHLPAQWSMSFSSKRGDLVPRFERREIWENRARLSEEHTSADIDEIASSMLGQCDAISRLPLGKVGLDITGGLDSRLVAALAIGSSLKDHVSALRTVGPENGHEIQVGRAVAESLGIEHKAYVPEPSQLTPETILKQIKGAMFRYDATVCPSDGLVGSARASRIILTGSAGEIYRRNCKPHMKLHIQERSELHAVYSDYHQRTNPMGLLFKDVAEAQRQAMRGLAYELYDGGADVNDISDIFYMRYRLPRWNGAMMNNIYSAVRLYPLVNFKAAKFAFSRGYKYRVGDKLHFELLLRINPDVSSIPYLNFAWPEDLRRQGDQRGICVADAPFKVQGRQSTQQRNGRMHVMTNFGLDLAKSYLLDQGNSRLWAMVDREKVERLFANGGDSFPGVVNSKQLFALLGMQAVLCDDMLADRDGRKTPAMLDGATATRLFGGMNACVG